jgi:hypothetical protein
MGRGAGLIARSFAAASITLAACGQLVGVESDDHTPPAPPPGADAADAPPGEDAHVDIEAQADAPADAAATDDSFCALQAPSTFCDDFDDTADASAAAKWSTSTGNVTLDTSQYESSPRSLHANGTGTSAVFKSFFVAHAISVDVDVHFASLPTGSAKMAPLKLEPVAGDYVVFYAATSADDAYYQQNGSGLGSDYMNSLLSGWHHLSLTVDLDAQTVTAYVDSTRVCNATPLSTSWSKNMTVTLSVGTADFYQVNSGDVFCRQRRSPRELRRSLRARPPAMLGPMRR